jgi:glutamate carboxypeptidase
MQPTEILEYHRSRLKQVIDAITQLVDIESPSRDRVQSSRVVDVIVEQATATGFGLEVERVAVPEGEHLILRSSFRDGRPILLLGHTDTVHPVGTSAANPTRIEADHFYGCGIFDMKANIAVILEALRYLAVSSTYLPRPITVVLSCDEEIGSHSGREIVEREAAGAEACLVLEPSAAGKAKTGRKGTANYVVSATGVPSHAGLEPEKGANAITELAQQIGRIHSIATPHLGSTVNVTTIRGGTTSNVIPELCSCEVDVRFTTLEEAERIDRELRSLSPLDPRVKLATAGGINRPPLERTAGVSTLYERARSLASSFGYELGETQVGGGSDGNFVGALGVPVLDGLGVNGDGAHTLHEHIHVSDIPARATLLTLLLQEL